MWMHALFLHDRMMVMSDDTTNHQPHAGNFSSEQFGTVRNDSESFGSVRNGSEEVGSIRNLSEELERVEKYTLTVREVARMFEEADVSRTERSIVKWCTPNPHGMPRLMCQFEPNERRWLITEESVRIAIAEEIVKQRELEARNPQAPEQPGTAEGYDERTREVKREERTNEGAFERTTFEDEVTTAAKDKKIRELEFQLRDEQIVSRAKDIALDRMEKERKDLLDQVVRWSHQVGVLETKLLQIEGPKQVHENEKSFAHVSYVTDVPNGSEQQENESAQRGEQGNIISDEHGITQ
jgi:hypothetical protein